MINSAKRLPCQNVKINSWGTVFALSDFYDADSQIVQEKMKLIGNNIQPEQGWGVFSSQGLFFLPGGVVIHGQFDLLFVNEVYDQEIKSPIWLAIFRPPRGIVEAEKRGILSSAQTGESLYLFRVNPEGEVDQVVYKFAHESLVTEETFPKNLLINESHFDFSVGAKQVCPQPKSGQKDNPKLWQGLQKALDQIIALHNRLLFCARTQPIHYEGHNVSIPGKEIGKNGFTRIPNGLPYVCIFYPLISTESLGQSRKSINQYAELTSNNSSMIFGGDFQKRTKLSRNVVDLVLEDVQKCRLSY